MTLQTAIGMLNVANTGNDLIAILDVISNDMDVNNANDIACVGVTDFNGNAVEFWYLILTYVTCLWYTNVWASEGSGCVCPPNMCKTLVISKNSPFLPWYIQD